MDQDYLEWKQWQATEFGQCSKPVRDYLFWHVRRAFPGMPHSLKVLEIGFGNGQFLSFCRSHGFSVTGVEINPFLVERARAAGYRAVHNIEEAAVAGPFDLIAAFDVLEHLDVVELGGLMDSMDRLLSDDGCLLIRVPNGDSPFGRRHQHGDLTHVNAYGEFKFRQIAQKWNLSVLAIGESPWHIDELGSSTVKSALRGALKRAIELLFGFVFFRQDVSLDANLVVVLKKRQAPRDPGHGPLPVAPTEKPQVGSQTTT